MTLVLGGHWLLIEVLLGSRHLELRSLTGDSPEPWIWIPSTPQSPREQPPEPTKSRPSTQSARPVRTKPAAGPVAAPVPPRERAEKNAPDWVSEAHSVAQSMAPQLNNELEEKCATARRLAQALPPGCKKESFEKDWRPQPQRTGFVGIFPYVRLGKCIIGLGFFGCAVQEPTADGTLFEDFRNPDRPRSSVPDLPDQTFPQAPIPQVFK
jgi:hypothetical protein